MIEADFGHVKISRKMFDARMGDPLWLERRERTRLEAWLDLIQMACFAAYRHATSQGVIDLDRGEFVASRRFLADRWQWSEKRVRNFMIFCLETGRLEVRSEAHAGTVYRLVNYDTYQNPQRGKGPQKGQATDSVGAQQGPSRGPRDKQVKASTTQELRLSDASPTRTDFVARTGASDDPLGLVVDPPSDVAVVLDHYVVVHPRRRPGPKDRALVEKALKLGYSAGELCEAIDGNAADDWHRERNKHELGYVLRDNGKIDDFRARAAQAAAGADEPLVDEFGCLTEYGERVTRP